MKKVMATIFAALSISSAFVYADSKQATMNVNLCAEPANWKLPTKWHLNAIAQCQQIKCTLIDESGGVPDPDPRKNTFWENIAWTFSEKGTPVNTGECKAFPMDPTCDFNTPRHTCAALFLLHPAAFQRRV